MYAVFGGFPEIVKKLLGLFVNLIVKYFVSMLDLVPFAFNCRRQPDALNDLVFLCVVRKSVFTE